MNSKNYLLIFLFFLNLSIFLSSSFLHLRITIGDSLLYSISKPFLLINNHILQLYDEVRFKIDVFRESEKRIKSLEDEYKVLKERVRSMEQIQLENKELKEYLLLNEFYTSEKISAKVIGGSSSIYQSTVVLDKGKNDNINNGSGIINIDGVVGQIINTYPTSSNAILLTDPRFKIDVELLSSGQKGLLVGNNDNCIVKYLPIDKSYVAGEMVFTSGFNDIFPKGIPVGYVSEIVDDKLYKSVIVLPFIKKYSLNIVSIIKNR